MKKFVFLLIILSLSSIKAFAQFTSKNDSYEIYLENDNGNSDPWVIIAHFMGEEMVSFSADKLGSYTSLEKMQKILEEDSGAIDKWVRGNSDYNYFQLQFDSSRSSSTTTSYTGFRARQSYTVYMTFYFANDHKSCLLHSGLNPNEYYDSGASFSRIDISRLWSAKYKLMHKNKGSDSVIYE